MATILEFRQELTSVSSARTATGGTAEIVFFPGVRYERMAEPKRAQKRRQRRQERLDVEGGDC